MLKLQGDGRNIIASGNGCRSMRWMMEIQRYPRNFNLKCGGGMYPNFYKGVDGGEYRISDVQY